MSNQNLHATVDDKPILRGIDLHIRAGEVHAIMGPNGSGKSTLANVLAGREGYTVTEGRVLFEGVDLLAMPAEERAQAGVFLAFQYPVELPGVANLYFLKAALNTAQAARRARARRDGLLEARQGKMKLVELDQALRNAP